MTITLYELAGSDTERPFSPHCWKVAMALTHKGLPFRRVATSFTEVPKVEGGISKTVPVIRDGEQVLSDSFDIARYLENTYPDRSTLFGGDGGEALARFIERWTQLVVQSQMINFILTDIHGRLGPVDQDYFRKTREARFGRKLEEVVEGRDERRVPFRASLEPLRSMLSYQPFVGGAAPLFADYIVFGALQWARVVSPYKLLADDDPIAGWFERCLDLHDGFARLTPAAA